MMIMKMCEMTKYNLCSECYMRYNEENQRLTEWFVDTQKCMKCRDENVNLSGKMKRKKSKQASNLGSDERISTLMDELMDVITHYDPIEFVGVACYLICRFFKKEGYEFSTVFSALLDSWDYQEDAEPYLFKIRELIREIEDGRGFGLAILNFMSELEMIALDEAEDEDDEEE